MFGKVFLTVQNTLFLFKETLFVMKMILAYGNASTLVNQESIIIITKEEVAR